MHAIYNRVAAPALFTLNPPLVLKTTNSNDAGFGQQKERRMAATGVVAHVRA